MAKRRHLSRAPIREAAIDIQFQTAANLDDIACFAKKFAEGKGRLSDVWNAAFELRPDGPQPIQTRTHTGIRLDLDDGKHVVQFRVGRFTYSRLPPYDTWETMSAGASEIWREYAAIMRPQVVSRVAVRYINALSVPLPIKDLDDYLTCGPQVPPGLPQTLGGFLNRLQIDDAGNGDSAVVTQLLQGRAEDGSGVLDILFDIDAIHSCQFKPDECEQIFSALNRLRDLKNRIFFGFLEEKTLEPYI